MAIVAEPPKEAKQLPVFQWHSVVPYFNITRPPPEPKVATTTPVVVVETKPQKKVTLPPKRTAIHQSISDHSKCRVNNNVLTEH